MAEISTLFRDCVCLYDDIAPTTNPAEKYAIEKKLEYLIRAYGDCTGRQKMENKRKIEQTPQGLAAITAESSSAIKNASSLARCFLVNINIDDVNLEILTEVQKNQDMFTTAVYNYILYIAKNFDKYLDKFKAAFVKNRLFFENHCSGIHPRLIMNGAWLHTSFVAYLDYANHEGFISNDAKDKLVDENKNILSQMLLEQDFLIKQDGEVELFLVHHQY